jgi:hypothetical protein
MVITITRLPFPVPLLPSEPITEVEEPDKTTEPELDTLEPGTTVTTQLTEDTEGTYRTSASRRDPATDSVGLYCVW